MTTKGTDNRFRSLTVVGESGTPATPASGDFKLYVADDGTFYLMDDTGTPTAIGGGGFSDPMTTRGDIIIRNASNVTARLGIGSAGKVLSSDGTDISWQTPSTGGLVLLEQHTASSSATLDFTTAITSTYDEYLVEFLNVVPASNNVSLYLRMSTNGGSSYDSSGIYDYAIWYAFSGGTGAVTSTNQAQLLVTDAVSSNTNYGVCGSVRLFSPLSTSVYKLSVGQVMRFDQGGTAIVALGPVGTYRSTTAVDAFRAYFSSGNIASGTIRVYGVAK